MSLRTYNVTLGRVHATNLHCKSSKNYIFWVCVCRLRYPACNAHPPYYHLRPAWLYRIFPRFLINGMIFGGDIKFVFYFLNSIFSETFPELRRIHRDIVNVLWYSCKVPLIFVEFKWNMNFVDRLFDKYSNIIVHEHIYSGNWVVPCGETDWRTDRRDMTELTVAFHNFANAFTNVNPSHLHIDYFLWPDWTLQRGHHCGRCAGSVSSALRQGVQR